MCIYLNELVLCLELYNILYPHHPRLCYFETNQNFDKTSFFLQNAEMLTLRNLINEIKEASKTNTFSNMSDLQKYCIKAIVHSRKRQNLFEMMYI